MAEFAKNGSTPGASCFGPFSLDKNSSIRGGAELRTMKWSCFGSTFYLSAKNKKSATAKNLEKKPMFSLTTYFSARDNPSSYIVSHSDIAKNY